MSPEQFLFLFLIGTSLLFFILWRIQKKRTLKARSKAAKLTKEKQADTQAYTLKLEQVGAENRALKAQYGGIMNMEEAIGQRKTERDAVTLQLAELKENYSQGKGVYQNLKDQIRLYEEDLDMLEFGVYRPRFDYDSSEKYKAALSELHEKLKVMIKNEDAAVCNTAWTVGESRAKGQLMIKRGIKLTLRAFNGECDALIAKVKWNNVVQYEKRIEKAFETINKANKSNDIHITEEYRALKIEELLLAHELEMKKHEEKEEQRQIREQIREEEKAQRELEKAQKQAEEEERKYQQALQQAQREVESATGAELDRLNAEMERLRTQLADAHSATERAISRAQMTKSGHVYVISNIGSFGEDVYKIGMTRRLEPMDRVKELGDASVPFQFDVHAMIYADDAPNLENELHQKFQERRVNLINRRKEYFKVSLREIETAVNEVAGAEIEFTQLAEAEEYRETLALLRQLNTALSPQDTEAEKFPEHLF